MKFKNSGASAHVPDGIELEKALMRTTHLGIGAHQDDLEIMAINGITLCYNDPHRWFGGVTCTDGAGSPRGGEYLNITPEELIKIRHEEQIQAATLGNFSYILQLDYPSDIVKDTPNKQLEDELVEVISRAKPQVIYTHNPADKHTSHVAVMVATIKAVRRLASISRPEFLYGCEVWRSLDWLDDKDKVALPVLEIEKLAEKLVSVYSSQIESGKRYDLATLGRRRANATYHEPYSPDATAQLVFAMDLTPLIKDDSLDLLGYVRQRLHRFQRSVEDTLESFVK